MTNFNFDKETLENIIEAYYTYIKPLTYCYVAIMYYTKYRSFVFTIIMQLMYNYIIHISNWIGLVYISYLYSNQYKNDIIQNLSKKYVIKKSETLGYQIQHMAFSVLFYVSTYKCIIFWISLLTGNITSTILPGNECGFNFQGTCFFIETLYEHILIPYYIQSEYVTHLKMGRRSTKFSTLLNLGYKMSIIIALVHVIISWINYFITGSYPFYMILSYPAYISSTGLLIWIPCVYYLEQLLVNIKK